MVRLDRWFALLVTAGVVVVLSVPARAAEQFSWQRVRSGDGQALGGVSCPSVSLCVAVDSGGDVLTSTDPSGVGSAWTLARVDGSRMGGLTCPSVSLCVALDDAGNVLTSTDPTGGPRAWIAVRVDDGRDVNGEGQGLTAMSCPSVSLCVGVDGAGDVVSSTDPTGGAGAWTVSFVDDGINYECYHYDLTGPTCQPGLWAVSCASPSFCVAADDAGNLLSSSDPAGGASAWSGAGKYGAGPMSAAFDGVSCPSVAFCAVVDNYAGQVETWNPGQPGPTWTWTLLPQRSQLDGVSCPSVSLCLVFDASGDIYVSSDPSGGAWAWSVTNLAKVGLQDGVTGVSCPSESFCVAVDGDGGIFAGVPIPSRREIKALLARQLRPHGRAAKISPLVRHDGYTLTFVALTRGRATFSWYWATN